MILLIECIIGCLIFGCAIVGSVLVNKNFGYRSIRLLFSRDIWNFIQNINLRRSQKKQRE